MPIPKQLKLVLRATGSVAAIAAVTFICSQLIVVNPTSVGFLYLVTILVIATEFGLAESVLASLLATLCYNFFFLPPSGQFTIEDPLNWVALLAFLITSLVASQLSQRAKQRTIEAVGRHLEMERLYALSRAILLADTDQPFAKQIAREIARIYEARSVVIHDRSSGETHRAGPDDIENAGQGLQDAAVRGTQWRDERAQTIISAIGFGGHPVGSLALKGVSLSDMALEGLSNLVSLGLERARAQDAANRANAARQSEEFKSTLLDALAHEFKTPLTSIKAATSALLSSGVSRAEDQHEMLTIVDQEATRLAALVTEADHLAPLEAGKLKLNKQPCSIRTLIEATLSQMEPALEGRKLDLSVSEDLPMVLIDVELMQLVLRHLIDNAVKCSPAGSPIAIAARPSGEAAVICVRNQGEGISEWEKAKIFEKFYRGSNASQRLPGTGMGLSIAHEILLAHGGDIRVESGPGKGAEFFASVPAPRKEVPV